MNNNLYFKEIEEKIKTADTIKDINVINKDIEDGKEALKSSDFSVKYNYREKIKQEYNLYVEALNLGMQLRVRNLGSESVRVMEDINETISMYINMLILVKDGKMLDEIMKVVNNIENKFEGGVFSG